MSTWSWSRLRDKLRRVLVILAIIAGGPVSAQLLPIRNYTMKEGLNANAIYAILRDSRGMLWVGTYNGVNWYDGSRFIQPVMRTRTGQIYVTHFLEDSAHTVWITTWYSGLYKYSNGRFTNYLPDTVLLGSRANSIFDLLELGSGRYLAATDMGVWVFDGHRFTPFDPANPLLQQQINALACTKQGDILLGYKGGLALYKRSGTGWVYKGLLLKGMEVNNIKMTGNGCWLGTEKGLWYLPGVSAGGAGSGVVGAGMTSVGRAGSAGAPRKLFDAAVVDHILTDGDNNLWFTSGAGAHKFSGGMLQTYTSDNGLPSNRVKSIYTDAEGITWIGTEDGLAKLNDESYRFYPIRDHEKKDRPITAIAADGDGQVWLGSYDGPIRMQGDQSIEVRVPGVKQPGFVLCMRKDSRQRLWAGTVDGILTIERGSIRVRNKARAFSIAEDGEGRLWFGCDDGKIRCLEGEQFREVANPAYINEKITGIYRDKAGYLWVGYPFEGIKKFRVRANGLEPVKQYSHQNGFPNLRVRSFCDDRKGHLLVGTRTNGLYIFDMNRDLDSALYHINTDSGLSGNWIKAAVEGNGKIYLASNNGLDILEAGGYRPVQLSHIPFVNDKVSTEFNALYLQSDTLWLGTERGALQYLPLKQNRNSMPPPVYLMKVSIESKADSSFLPFTTHDQRLSLSSEENDIALDFAGLSFREEENIRYRYQLEGVDKTWGAITDRRYVNYSNLAPGDYRFRVIARNNDGVWSKVPAVLAFHIATPFWRTWWFICLWLLVIAGLIYALYRYRLRQVLKMERLRARISTDLHDDIGSTLSSISIMSDMILHEERPGSYGGMALEIKESSLSLMDKMDDIVWSINPKHDELENLMLRIRRFAAQLFEARGIEYEIDIEDDIRHLKLSMDYRQHIYLIMKEAINNLAKYSGAQSAFIKAGWDRSQLKVVIGDDGRGFDVREGSGGNGIANMKNRAQQMKATLDIHSVPGTGTTVTLLLKVK
jgi:ligand-binding sensor domain-containing protein